MRLDSIQHRQVQLPEGILITYACPVTKVIKIVADGLEGNNESHCVGYVHLGVERICAAALGVEFFQAYAGKSLVT